MKINKDILQKFIDLSGKYLIAQKYSEGFGASRGQDEWHAVFLSANLDRKLWDKKVGELPFDTVEAFAESEIMTNIYFGKSYPPFQYGLRYKDIISLEECTCKADELIHRCYEEDVKDYYKVLEIMKELTPTITQDNK